MSLKKGSFTIEAAIWVPLIMFMLVTAIEEGITLYEKCANAQIEKELLEWDAVLYFYELSNLNDFLEGDETQE